MHDDRTLVELRVDRFLRERILPARYRSSHALSVEAWTVPGEPVPFATAAAAEYEPAPVGTPWGAPWGTTWFRVQGSVPAAWRSPTGELPEGTRAELVVDLGFTPAQAGFQAEGLIHRTDGTIVKAISPFNAASAGAVSAAGVVDVFIEAAANPDIAGDWSFSPTPIGDRTTAGGHLQYVLRRVDVALLDLTVWDLAQDVRVLVELMKELPVETARRAQILRALEHMANVVDPDDVSGTAARGRAALSDVLASPAHASAHVLHAVGHAHIDSAWLWPIRETIRKCARTFSNVLALMDEDPAFTFACSSAQQFAWMKRYYPALFARIRDKVASGQFIPVGGMWVESDTNMPGSEALARQFVAGKSFFLQEFGIENEEVWLPDSFGYSGSMPAIVRAAGAKWFLTQKLSWNETNVIPHHTFRWEGIDGTQVFTHFPPVDKYNSDLVAADLHHAQASFKDSGAASMSLLPYGYGDGGGGPTREMVAVIERATSLEGSPRVEHSTPRAFFEAAELEYRDPPVWVGELYLEFHRGTYTSQLATKQGNRRSEMLLREAELWSTYASVATGAPYPAAELAEIWETVLLQQFHDILPGSSIAWVHRDAERNYAALAVRLESLITGALTTIAGSGEHTLVVNSAPHARNGVAAMGASSVPPRPSARTARRVGDGFVLESARLRAEFDRSGLLTSLLDLVAHRETIAPGRVGNLLQLFRDTPTQWDAWDIDQHYRENVTDLVDADSVTLDPDGATLRIVRSIRDTTITQSISLSADGGALDIALDVDWHESQKLLKLAFPLDLHAATFASEIQFGHIERPTYTNTSWDFARFETCAHRWIRIAESDYGVAVVNDSTYGHDVSRQQREGGGTITVARLSLLRAARFPDPEQDQGRHSLAVQVRPGATVTDAIAAGYHLNLAERSVQGAAVDALPPLLVTTDRGLVVEAVKLAEDGSGDVVVRLYESLGRRYTAEVVPAFPVSSVAITDLLERPVDDPATLGQEGGPGRVSLRLRPFQIVTLRFRRGTDDGRGLDARP